jgi:outer membrane murein-binding lipoprotein Lpp
MERSNLNAFWTLVLSISIAFTMSGREQGASVANPNAEVKELSTKVGRLENEVQALRERMDNTEIIRENNRIAYLTPGAGVTIACSSHSEPLQYP